ncbi:preprotein translocase subunit SecY [Dehalococcoidia bacterium]|nr:preprotein translocase subunit SecY [Dehalococcoidia bacterium]
MQRSGGQGGMPKLLQAVMDSLHHPDLRRKLLFTFGILVVFRFAAHIPLPGVDVGALRETLDAIPALAMLDLFAGGAMRNLSIVAVGIFPYITASIIMQLMVPVIPRLQMLSREGEGGRNKLKQYTLWLTVPMAMLSGYGQLVLFSRPMVAGVPAAISGVGLSGELLLPTISMVLSLTAGTMLLVWLGERITEGGIGNGISIIIFGGIVAGMPEQIGRTYVVAELWGVMMLLLMLGALALLIVFVTEGHRRIPVQYSKSTFRGGRVYRQSGGTHIPLRVNSAGMIPIIFAFAVIMFPATIATWFANPPGVDPNFANWIIDNFTAGGDFWWAYYSFLFLLVVGFTFFYTIITFEQQNIPETLQKQGAFIPGIRPGRSTAEYVNGVLMRITWGGAIFLGFVAITPVIGQWMAGVPLHEPVMIIGGVGLLIVVGVVLDTMRQMEAQLLMRHYEGFIK